MFLSKLSGKEKVWMFFSVVFVCLVIMDRLILTPINERVREINREIKINEAQLAVGMRNLKQKVPITEEYKKYASYLKSPGSDEEKTTSILSEIENLAKKSAVSLADMKPQPPKKIDFYKMYTVEVRAEGSMEALVNFLYQLNLSPQLLRAEKVRLNLKEKDSAVVAASVLITKVSVY
jgi:Tfp pilus assembly protein PilO